MRELLFLKNMLSERHEIEVRIMIETLQLSSSLRIFFNSVNFPFDSKAVKLQGVLYS